MPRDFNAAFADVLARAAALPRLDPAEYPTLDEQVQARIAWIVAHSPLQLEFPPDFDLDDLEVRGD